MRKINLFWIIVLVFLSCTPELKEIILKQSNDLIDNEPGFGAILVKPQVSVNQVITQIEITSATAQIIENKAFNGKAFFLVNVSSGNQLFSFNFKDAHGNTFYTTEKSINVIKGDITEFVLSQAIECKVLPLTLIYRSGSVASNTQVVFYGHS